MDHWCRLVLPGSSKGDCWVSLPISSLEALKAVAQQDFGPELAQDFLITDTQKTFDSDADVQQLLDGATLVLVCGSSGALAAPATEKISFQPHPKTLTMAGEFEYFAAQGRHPFVYALAEFVDNSLRATKRNAPRPRSISISLVVSGNNPATASGLVAIQDNGCGMNKHELADWAVMNLSMEERGAAPQEPDTVQRGGANAAGNGAGRFLTGDLSFFGVGSKNAGFFMGNSIKVSTKRADELYVHELRLAAADLERRYHNREEVYVETMVHRNPADASTLSPAEQPFSLARAWVAAEGEEADSGGTGPSFTRVVISDLKPDVLRQLMDEEQGPRICQELAHLYHYYLHGEQGNCLGGSKAIKEGRLPNGEPLPDIVLRYQVDSHLVWQQRLCEVEDDLETRLLRAQQAEFPFTLQVPDRGTVCGVLYYYPYCNDQETVPAENSVTAIKPMSSPFGAGLPTQLPTQLQLRGTQHPAPRMTQIQPRGTQLHGGGGAAGMEFEEDEDEALGAWQVAPIFEAFWQGRLIPGARIDTLPFLEAVRQKRTAQGKDMIPDEAFRRLRGALFFGPAFRVTRNKLLFRDNLPDLLAAAVPGERQLEAKFKAWLQRCHATLDKSVRFEALGDSHTQSLMRSKLGEETTAFERITDGSRTVCKGDVVRINAKPHVVGRVLCFSISQAVREEGCYANGRVNIELLPVEAYGPSCQKQFSLRRIEAVLTKAEQQEHVQKELLKVADSLRVEPMRFAMGQTLDFIAGDSIPETTVSVLSGGGQRMIKTPFTNERFVVTQRLWRIPAGAASDAGGGGDGVPAEENNGKQPGKRQRRGKKGRLRQDENTDPAAAAPSADADLGVGATIPAGAELLLTLENRTPIKDTFQFGRISDGLKQAGSYMLEFEAKPAPPGQLLLRTLVRLIVAPGLPSSLSLSGEGTATAAVKEFALGEALPPIKVQFSDKFGNLVAMQPSQTPPVLCISASVMAGSGELQPCEELQVVAPQLPVQDGLLISGLQLLGSSAAPLGPEAPGLHFLAGGDAMTHPTARQAQVQPSKQGLPAAEVQLSFSLQSSQELEPVILPLRLRAGAPHSLRLLPGHPWELAEQGDLVTLQHGSSIAAFQVAVFDAWGNPTAPSSDLPFTVVAECAATNPQRHEFVPSAVGIANIEGLVGATSTVATGPVNLRLSLKSSPVNANTELAVAAADPTEAFTALVAVEPSVMPTSLQVLWDGQPLPTKQVHGDDGPSTVALLEGMVAGSSANPNSGSAVGGLRIVLLDESGAAAAQQLTGKITASWRSGSKKSTWTGEQLKLPPVKVPESVADTANEWVRFTCSDPPVVLEAPLEIRAVPAAPATWALSMVDQLTSQNCEELGVVHCGKMFALEAEAIDAFNNRCRGGGASLPIPLLTLESEGPLEFNEQEWEQGWVSQGGEEVYSVRMTVSGHPGPVKITVKDTAGEGGQSLLAQDSLSVELRAGPPAQLALEGPGTLECGTKAVIPQLRLRVCDSAGNPITNETFEVSLNSSALATDSSGRAASVSVSGGNKIKLKKGAAMFKDVHVVADEAGSYALRVQSASRKVAVSDAVLHLIMQPLNAVTDLRVLLPEMLRSGDCQAGSSAELHVAMLTEDGLPLPLDVVSGGLTLIITPPGGGKSDAVVYTLDGAGGEEGMRSEEGHYAFQLAELTAGGTYSAYAEYTETRPALVAGLAKKDVTLRSASVRFHVQPCQPVTMRLEAASLPDKLAVTNGSSSKQRLLLRNVGVQLLDAYGNAAAGSGVQVRCRLRLAPDAAASSSALPELESSEGGGLQETDAQGRAFLGDLSIAEGSGCSASGALECELVCEALGLYPSSAHELEMDSNGWALCWSCPVLFSDDAARFAHIERLNQRHGQLAQQRDDLNKRVSSARRAAEDAQQEQQRLQQAMSIKEKQLPGPVPSTLKSAMKQLAAARREAEAAATAEPEEAVEARYGNPKHAMTASIDRILQSGDPGLVGVMAQLATVDDSQLSAVLAAALRGPLTTVVVQDGQARQRIAAMLTSQRYPVPDMLPTTLLIAPNAKAGDTPGFDGAGQRAHKLQAAACHGTDPPLAMALPHTACMSRMRDREQADGLGMCASQWPAGCLGFAFNLVRPTQKGHRATILSSQLGSTLVFETLKDAERYKEFLSQKLRTGSGVFLSLDGGRIMSNGVVSGASFQVPPLDRAEVRFGSTGSVGENRAMVQAAERVTLLEEWVELVKRCNEADQAAAAAQGEAEQVEAECRVELEGLQTQIAELDAQLALGDMATGADAEAAQSGRKKRSRRHARQQADDAEEQQQPTEEQQHSGRKRRRRAA